jgi:non-homologous end joining protein Ku
MDIWNFTQDDIMAARSIWKGAISFGLVNIPIQVFSAEQKEEYTSS